MLSERISCTYKTGNKCTQVSAQTMTTKTWDVLLLYSAVSPLSLPPTQVTDAEWWAPIQWHPAFQRPRMSYPCPPPPWSCCNAVSGKSSSESWLFVQLLPHRRTVFYYPSCLDQIFSMGEVRLDGLSKWLVLYDKVLCLFRHFCPTLCHWLAYWWLHLQ